jgi:anti-sigma28 factor (negative regulator of flagellin synthesis)
MSDSSQPTNEPTAIAENTDSSLNWGPDSGFQGKIATMLVQDSCVPSGIRMEKVLAIRRQLADGVYSMDKRLDATLDRLLKAINT